MRKVHFLLQGLQGSQGPKNKDSGLSNSQRRTQKTERLNSKAPLSHTRRHLLHDSMLPLLSIHGITCLTVL